MRFMNTRQRILYAQDANEIYALLREALSALSPDELALLPDACWRCLASPHDIHTAAVSCLHHDLKHRADPEVGTLVRQVAELLASASVRLSHIEHQRAQHAPA